MGGCGQMLTFAYKVGGWGWQNAYVIIRINEKWISRKIPIWLQVYNFRVLNRYKFYHWWQIVHFSQLNYKNYNLNFLHQDRGKLKIKKWNSCFKKFLVHLKKIRGREIQISYRKMAELKISFWDPQNCGQNFFRGWVGF